MLEYNRALLERGEAIRKSLAKKTPDHAELSFIDADLAGRRAIIGQLEAVRARADVSAKAGSVSQDFISPEQAKTEMLAALGLTPEQLAQHPDQITPDTKVYVGDLVHTDSQGKIIPIFEKLASVEHIYTSYPEGKISSWSLEIGGRKPKELEKALYSAKINVGSYARSMIRSHQFTTFDKPEIRRLVKPSVRDMGFPTGATTSQIFERADKLGLNKCDAEAGVYQRLADRDQKMNTAYWIGMDPISDSGGGPGVFGLGRRGGGLWLGGDWAGPGGGWDPADGFVFSPSKLKA